MKILFSANRNPHFPTITEYVETALKKECDCSFFDDRSFMIPGRLRDAVPVLRNWDLSRINKRLIAKIKRVRPDFLLQTGGQRIFSATIDQIKEMGITTILWTIDPPADFQATIEFSLHYDFVFTGGSEAYELLDNGRLRNLHWLPFACDINFHKPWEPTQKGRPEFRADIVFVGSFYPNRMAVLEQIADFDLGVWGPGWEKVPAGSPLKRRVRRAGGVTPAEWRQIYSSAKMAVVIHYQDGRTPCYQASPKVYEILACRCFLLADNQPDVRALFKDGAHLAVFKDIADLREKINYYLENHQERKRISAQGYAEVVEKHTYARRVKEMLSIVRARGEDGK